MSEEKLIKANQQKFSCYIFEFHQGHHPNVVWNYGCEIECLNDLIWYVVTTPAAQDTPLSTPKPSLFISKFDKYYFIAIYTLIPDYQARGFSRTVCICLAHSHPLFASMFTLGIIEKLSSCLSKLAKSAFPIFIKQMAEYVGQLNSTIENVPDAKSRLQPIQDEIQNVLKEFGIKPEQNLEPQHVDFFTMINNDLRDVKDMTDFVEFTKELKNIISQAPCTRFLSTTAATMSYNESSPLFSFGGITGIDSENSYAKFSVNIIQHKKEINSHRFKVYNFIKPKIFHHCIFSLLSGRTLVIETADTENGILLAKKFSIFVPFFTESKFGVVNHPSKGCDLKMYSVVVVPSAEHDSLESVSYLNVDLCYYEGTICPCTSMLFKYFDFTSIHTESSLLLYSFMTLKRISSDFLIEIEKWEKNVPKNIQGAHDTMTKMGLKEEDDQILQYWMYSWCSKNGKKTVLLKNPAIAGVGIVTYYEL